jgi:hypothetical protein
MEGMKNACKIFVAIPEGKRPLERSWRRWEDNIKMNLKGIRYEVMNCIHLAQDRN